MSSQTVWLPTALYTALIRWQMDDFTAIGFVNAIFGDKAESQIRQRRYRYTFIYRHLIKLVNQGLLKRKHVDDGKRFSHFIREGANKSYGTRAFTGNPLILND